MSIRSLSLHPGNARRRDFRADGSQQRAVLIDGDMLVMRNIDDLFDLPLPPDWIAANHACVCNLDRQPWAPKDWLVLHSPRPASFSRVLQPPKLTFPQG